MRHPVGGHATNGFFQSGDGVIVPTEEKEGPTLDPKIGSRIVRIEPFHSSKSIHASLKFTDPEQLPGQSTYRRRIAGCQVDSFFGICQSSIMLSFDQINIRQMNIAEWLLWVDLHGVLGDLKCFGQRLFAG